MEPKTKSLTTIIILIAILLFFMIVRTFIMYYYRYNIFLIGDEITTIEVGSEYKDLGYEFIPKRDDLISKVEITNTIDVNKIGEYEISYCFNGPYRQIKTTRKVIVKDTTAPTIKLSDTSDIYTLINVKINYPKATASDNYDGDLTKNVTIESNIDYTKVGTYKLIYKVADSSDNETSTHINVHVEESKNAYIDVSIKKQKLYYYEFNKLILESDIVSGYKNSTPYGTFKIINKARNIILRGIDYNSFVEYWIDFKNHVYGFHDASWRSKFGGDIYISNGSHGCVNMPKDKVAKLYEYVEIGTPVYIHD